MKVFSLATLTLKRNKKQYMIYGLTLIFAIVIHLIFSEFINNPYLIEADRARGIDDPLGADIPLSMGLPFLIILFCWFMIIYASQYNFNKKHQEFGILFTCGFNLLDFIKYTLIQMGIVFIFVLPISFILGVLSLFFIHSKIYPYLQINYSIYTIMPSTFFTTISALCVLVVIVIIFLIGITFCAVFVKTSVDVTSIPAASRVLTLTFKSNSSVISVCKVSIFKR